MRDNGTDIYLDEYLQNLYSLELDVLLEAKAVAVVRTLINRGVDKLTFSKEGNELKILSKFMDKEQVLYVGAKVSRVKMNSVTRTIPCCIEAAMIVVRECERLSEEGVSQ